MATMRSVEVASRRRQAFGCNRGLGSCQSRCPFVEAVAAERAGVGRFFHLLEPSNSEAWEPARCGPWRVCGNENALKLMIRISLSSTSNVVE